MKPYTLVAVFVLFLCTCPVLSRDAYYHPPENGKIEPYSVEKTIETAKTVLSGYWWGPLSHTFDPAKCPLNPAALPEMYRILEDPNQQNDWGDIVSYIALLGSDADVEKLESVILRYKNKKIDQSEKMILFDVQSAISAMESRKIPKAEKLVDRMMEPEYWQTLHITLPKGQDAAFDFGPLMIRLKSNNADPRYKEKVQTILDSIQDTELKKIYTETFTRNAVKNYDEIMESKRTGDWTIYYGKPDPTPTPSITIKRYCPPQSSYDALYTSATLWNVSTPLDAKAEQALCKEALDAFKAALQATIKGDVDYLVTHTAVDGRPLLLKDEQTPGYVRGVNIKQILDPSLKMKEKWQRLIPVAQAFLGKALEPSEHFVYQCPGFGQGKDGANLPAPPFFEPYKKPKTFKSLLVLRFRYDDLRDVAKKYPEIFNNKGRIPAVSENGEPYVVMIWENEQWYWNPFGV